MAATMGIAMNECALTDADLLPEPVSRATGARLIVPEAVASSAVEKPTALALTSMLIEQVPSC